jgi:FkbM family methyltransferase
MGRPDARQHSCFQESAPKSFILKKKTVKKIFDIGMYDGSDTAYYLESGHQVVAVEANPELVKSATKRFSSPIASGQLICLHAAISHSDAPVELNLCGDDLGSSSIFSERIADRRPAGGITVPGVTLLHLFERYGVPDYLKVDIEGADRLCVLSLTTEHRPEFISFEAGDDVDELIAHAEEIGYRRFKAINQISFRELANQWCLYDRIAHRLMRHLGYREPELVRRSGHFFPAGHSSGPVPWHSDGRWYSGEATRERLHQAKAAGTLSGWYDIHAHV